MTRGTYYSGPQSFLRGCLNLLLFAAMGLVGGYVTLAGLAAPWAGQPSVITAGVAAGGLILGCIAVIGLFDMVVGDARIKWYVVGYAIVLSAVLLLIVVTTAVNTA